MAERTQKQKPTPLQREDIVADPVGSSEAGVSGDAGQLRAELDDLLDEIDGVLESNAEEFVKSYVQKGGE